MFLFLYPFVALLDILGTLFFCLFVNWWAPLFATKDARLPNWLKWVETFDADLDEGMRAGFFAPGTSVYWGRVKWLYRNPAYGLSFWLFGAQFEKVDWQVVTYTGDEHAPDFTFFAKGPNGLFNLHCIRFGVRFKLGWKAWNQHDHTTGLWKVSSIRIPVTFSIMRAK